MATHSPDPSTQNGAALLDIKNDWIYTAACNRFPEGVEYLEERWSRPLKYSYVEHAERGAIYAAARNGICTRGLTMVCIWAACADCARAIVESNIKELIRLPIIGTHWADSITHGDIILKEGGVSIKEFPLEELVIPRLRMNGEYWGG